MTQVVTNREIIQKSYSGTYMGFYIGVYLCVKDEVHGECAQDPSISAEITEVNAVCG